MNMRPSRPPINGDVILAARLRKGLSQDEVQRQCAQRGKPVNNLSRMENGQIRWPSPSTLPVLAEVLGLEFDQLFIGEAA
jgi:transcriptional regulator with XRE-family HTH domain